MRVSSLCRSLQPGPTAPRGDGDLGEAEVAPWLQFQKAVTSARYLCQVLGDQSGPSRAEDSGRFASAQGLKEGLYLAAKRDMWLPVPKRQRWHRGWALSQDPPRSQGQAYVQRTLHPLLWLAQIIGRTGPFPPWLSPHVPPNAGWFMGPALPCLPRAWEVWGYRLAQLAVGVTPSPSSISETSLHQYYP